MTGGAGDSARSRKAAACRKRLSPAFDNIDAMSDRPQVRMHCRHCGHRFTVARSHR